MNGALVGSAAQTTFVDVTDPQNPQRWRPADIGCAGGGGAEGPPPGEGPQPVGETAGAGLAVTGFQVMLFVLVGLALIGGGTIMQRLRGGRL